MIVQELELGSAAISKLIFLKNCNRLRSYTWLLIVCFLENPQHNPKTRLQRQLRPLRKHSVLQLSLPTVDLKPSDPLEAGESYSFFILFFSRYFDHIGENFPGMLYLIEIFGQPQITSSNKTKHKAFHHIQRPATHLTT